MANFQSQLLFYALLITATALTAPLPLRSVAAQPQATEDDDGLRLQQLYNIIDALIGSGDFGNWANILSTSDPSMFPVSATLFVPGDSAFSSFSSGLRSAADPPLVDPLLFSYHVVPQRLSFSDLMLFPINSRLPTLLLDKAITITNNSRTNFTLNRSHLTRPDLFSTSSVSVHGIGDVLGFAVDSEPDSSSLTNVPPMPQVMPPGKQETVPSPPPQGPENPISEQPPPPPPALAIDEVNASRASLLGHLRAVFLSALCSVLGLTMDSWR